jgi:PPIC-type PPIASE domain.
LAKKKQRTETKRVPTKRQLSRWQRQERTRRIIIIAAAIFLAGIIGYVVHGYYDKEIKPSHEVVIEVNDASFNMGYYIKTLDAQTKGIDPNQISRWADFIASQIEQGELIRQGANTMGIEVTTQEVNKKIKEDKLPNDKVYKDMTSTKLLVQKLQEYFESQLPDKMEQAHIQVMLVEGRNVANNMTAAIQSGGNFTALANDFSCNSKIQGNLGWLPEELMPNPLIWDVASSLEPGNVSPPTYDSLATKDVGYWLIEVTDKMRRKA